jgi:hypothetical protein
MSGKKGYVEDKPEGNDHLGDLGVDGMLLKWILKK